jgi:UDP-GlcNAc:undecaprenyl-phosphate/decaprenyl-phosphate GlcNAc-1-phosphate transferase
VKEILLGFITSFFVVLLATPSLIKVAKMKHLVDEPKEDRKLHRRSIPTIGGIIIFAAIIFSYSLWFPSDNAAYFGGYYQMSKAFIEFKFMIASYILLFFIGVKDDIIGVDPMKKLIGHVIVGFILVVMADIRITSMFGLFNIHELPDWGSTLLSVFTYIVVVNAINLIDGVDGLAAGIGLITCCLFGVYFYLGSALGVSLFAFTLAGALFAFLIFNFSPAKIFMGDSGSLVIGASIYFMAISCIEMNTNNLPYLIKGISKPLLTMAILVYPLIDTIRVFIYRSLKGVSPFSADKNHIHHKLLSLGFSHTKTVFILYAFNILIAVSCLIFNFQNPTISFLILFTMAMLIAQIPFIFEKFKRKKVLN